MKQKHRAGFFFLFYMQNYKNALQQRPNTRELTPILPSNRVDSKTFHHFFLQKFAGLKYNPYLCTRIERKTYFTEERW